MGGFAFLQDGPAAYAHRGGMQLYPENTLEAFAHAVELGFQYVETDAHLTTDGHLVAFHDPDLNHTAVVSGKISRLTLAEVKSAKIRGSNGTEYSIPTLADILGTWPDLKVNIDPKTDAAVAPLVSMIRDFGALNRVCVGSFFDARLKECRRSLGPDLCTSMGPVEIARLRAGSYGLPVGRFTTPCAQIPEFYKGVRVLDARMVEFAHANNIQVHVWTVNKESEMHRMLDLGVDAVMTDELALLRSVFRERGVWHSG